MLYQIAGDINDIYWVIGIGLIFGLGFLINSLIKGNMQTLLLVMLAVNGVVVLAQLLDEWTLILNMIANITMLILNYRSNETGNE